MKRDLLALAMIFSAACAPAKPLSVSDLETWRSRAARAGGEDAYFLEEATRELGEPDVVTSEGAATTVALWRIDSKALSSIVLTFDDHHRGGGLIDYTIVGAHHAGEWERVEAPCGFCKTTGLESVAVFRSVMCDAEDQPVRRADGTYFDGNVRTCPMECERGHRWAGIIDVTDAISSK